MSLIAATTLGAAVLPALADKADVLEAVVLSSGRTDFTFHVTVKHGDTGWTTTRMPGAWLARMALSMGRARCTTLMRTSSLSPARSPA